MYLRNITLLNTGQPSPASHWQLSRQQIQAVLTSSLAASVDHVHDALCLELHLFILLWRIGENSDGATGADGDAAVLHDCGADDDVEVEGFIEANEAERAGVDAPGRALQPAHLDMGHNHRYNLRAA